MQQALDQQVNYHKIYYYFLYDPETRYELKFRSDKQIVAGFIKALLIVEHGIGSAAMCALQLLYPDKKDYQINDDEAINIGSTLAVKRIPIKRYIDALQKIINCFQNKQGDSLQLGNIDLGILPEDLNDIIKDNTGEDDIKSLIDGIKQRFMIQDDIVDTQQDQQQQTMYIPAQHNSRSARALRERNRRQNIEQANFEQNERESDESSPEENRENINETLKLLENKNNILGQWFQSGKLFKKERGRRD